MIETLPVWDRVATKKVKRCRTVWIYAKYTHRVKSLATVTFYSILIRYTTNASIHSKENKLTLRIDIAERVKWTNITCIIWLSVFKMISKVWEAYLFRIKTFWCFIFDFTVESTRRSNIHQYCHAVFKRWWNPFWQRSIHVSLISTLVCFTWLRGICNYHNCHWCFTIGFLGILCWNIDIIRIKLHFATIYLFIRQQTLNVESAREHMIPKRNIQLP